jgi:hypothetical protein
LFHIVEGPPSDELRQAVQSSPVPLPPSYKEFVLEFGNARFFRSGSIYRIEVYASPRESKLESGEVVFQFGTEESNPVFFLEEHFLENGESPVFRWSGPQAGLRVPLGDG